jgi:glutathione S-transferase
MFESRKSIWITTAVALLAASSAAVAYYIFSRKKKTMIDQSPITVGYWTIRGLGAPLRMMVMYSGVPLVAENYDLQPKEGGGWDGSFWYDDKKPLLKERNPFINLPYVIDGDLVLTQSNACLLYLGRKLDMMGDIGNPVEYALCEQLLCEIMDIRNKMVAFVYDPTSNTSSALTLLKNVNERNFPKFEDYLDRRKRLGGSGTFLVGEKASAPDFHLFEMLHQFETLSIHYAAETLDSKFPYLGSYKQAFRHLPGNAKYFRSDLVQMPFNQKNAVFGGTLSCDKWVHGMSYEWGNTSGVY